MRQQTGEERPMNDMFFAVESSEVRGSRKAVAMRVELVSDIVARWLE